MASHEELVAELQKLEKLSHAARLKHAKKRRLKQLKKYQEWLRYQRQTGSVMSRRNPHVVDFEDGAVLNDLVSRNDIVAVSNLLDKGADPNISNADGLTPLHKCCIDDTLEMAEILLEHGVDLNARDIEGWTPLHAAATTGNIQMINLLIDEGASLVAINIDDKMPIDVAADGDIRYILQQKMIEAGYTDDVLDYIRASVPKTMLADLKDSVRNNRSLNMQDKFGASALHVAAANGYAEVMDFLLEQEDVDLDIGDNEGWSPFHAAVCWNQPEMMRKLAKKGASIDLKNIRGETPYAIAEDPEIRQLILELKGEYGQAQEVSLEEGGGGGEEGEGEGTVRRPRRMSVKRISQQEKEERAKQSVHEEVSLRRESMVQHDIEMGLVGKADDKAISNEIATNDEEDEAAISLVRLKSFSVAEEASKEDAKPSRLSTVSESADDIATPLINNSTHSENKRLISDSTEPKSTSNGKKADPVRPGRTSIQEDPFNKSRVPRKSVLKRSNHPIARTPTTYVTSSSPPLSPSNSSLGSEGFKSPAQQDRKCCVVM